MRLKKTGVMVASLFFALMFQLNVDARPGDLDSTFDFDGKTTASFGTLDFAVDVAIQSDGKIVVAGNSAGGIEPSLTDFSLVRYNPDGSPDTSFGSGGKVFIPEPGDQRATALAIQSDGKIIVVGGTRPGGGGSYHLAVYRYNPDGSFDTTFGTNGKKIHVIEEGAMGNDAVLQPDGKLVIVGYVNMSDAGRLIVVRLNTDGNLDTSFNFVGYHISFAGFQASAVALQSDGKIVVGAGDLGSLNYGYGFWRRFNPNGSDEGGSLNTTNFIVEDLAVQPDGKIVCVGNIFTPGNNYLDFAVARYNADKTPDTTFGSLGKTVVAWGFQRSNIAKSLVIQPDGRIVVGGLMWDTTRRFALVRFNRSGFLDVGFGNSGKVSTQITGGHEEISGVARQTDGKIVVAGSTQNSNSGDFAVARYEGGASNTAPFRAPFDYDGDGRSDLSVFRPSENNWYLFNSLNSSVSVRQFGTTGDLPVPADYDGDGRTEIAVYRPSNGTWWYLSTADNTVVVVSFGGGSAIPRPSDYDGDGKADLVLYQPATGNWFRRGSLGQQTTTNFGIAEDKPLVGDFDGDGKGDLAVFRPSTGDWWYAASSLGGQHHVLHWGQSATFPCRAITTRTARRISSCIDRQAAAGIS